MFKRLLAILLVTMLAACGGATEPTTDDLTEVTLMLDYTPNTNHTGLFIAQEEGYFADEGLGVEIIQPGEVFPEQAVASDAADFGVSFQESLTLARAQSDTPIVSIAAVIQNNTSGFAGRAEAGIETPADFEGLTYGGFGTPYEEPTLSALMDCTGGNFSTVDVVNVGLQDPLQLLAEEQIDLAWIFYGWQGIQAELEGIDLDIVMMNEYFDCIPNYYTPIIITSERMIDEQPDVVSAFTRAMSRGYDLAIDDPDRAAEILLGAVPELDENLVQESQDWISQEYQADAPRWGFQRPEVWQDYTDWLVENGIIEEAIDIDSAFTNQFLP